MGSSQDGRDKVVIAHGGGGELMNKLIREHIVPRLGNATLDAMGDGAILPKPEGDIVFTTDSYVVTPLEFPGGDIGKLAIAGTVNDLAVMGATPHALSLGLILEEGLDLELLDRILDSMAETAKQAGVSVVTGDTKVIERRGSAIGGGQPGADGMFINTAGVGYMRPGVNLELNRAEPGDAILVNGNIAEHGLVVMSVRNGIEFETQMRSDAAPLNGLLSNLFESGVDVKFLRDATRGGIAGVLTDVCDTTGLTIEVEEQRLPLTPTARHAAEMLGLDPLSTANEGKVVCVVAGKDVDKAISVMRSHPLGEHSCKIAQLVDAKPAMVELLTKAGGRRVVQRPYGEELPRIC